MKKVLSLVSIAGLLVLASCSGDSSSAPAMPTPGTDTWAITSVTADDSNPLVGVTVVVTAVVTKNGDPAPDGTDVTFTSSGGNLGSGGTQVHVSTADGSATVTFSAAEAGGYTVQAQVASATRSTTVNVKNPDVTDDLEIYSVVPNEGSLDGGEMVTLTGKGVIPPVEVEFLVDGTTFPAEVVSVAGDYTSATVRTPEITGVDPAQEYTTDITIRVGVGTANQQQQTLTSGFRFLPVTGDPEIYSLFPAEGGWDGGDQVTVYGANFAAPVRVTFTTGVGTVDASEMTVASDGSQIALTTPPIAASDPGTDQVASVTVYSEHNTDREKVVTKTNAFVFTTDVPTPDITGISPSAGPMEGGTEVTIFGSGFATPIQVMFGTREAEVTSVDDDQILCVSPDYTPTGLTPPVTVNVTVTNLEYGLSDTLAGAFTYGESMFITSNSPSQGEADGGDVVTIYGSGFRDPLTVTWLGGGGTGVAQEVTSVSGNQVVITTSALDPVPCDDEEGPFQVTQVDSGVTAEGGSWTYLGDSPRIGSVQPGSAAYPDGGPAPLITIGGSRFDDPVRVTFGDSAANLETPVDEFTIETDLPDWRLFMELDAIECTGDQSFPGCRETGTPVDVTVVNVSSGCEDTLTEGFMYMPEVTDCREVAGDTTACSCTDCPSGCTPTYIDFGNVAIADPPREATLTLENTGTVGQDLTIEWDASTAAPFSVTPASGTLSPGASIDLTVAFDPDAAEAPTDTVTITATGGACSAETTIVVQVTGTGV